MDEKRKLYNWLVEHKKILNWSGIEKQYGIPLKAIYKAVNDYQDLSEDNFTRLQKAMVKYGYNF